MRQIPTYPTIVIDGGCTEPRGRRSTIADRVTRRGSHAERVAGISQYGKLRRAQGYNACFNVNVAIEITRLNLKLDPISVNDIQASVPKLADNAAIDCVLRAIRRIDCPPCRCAGGNHPLDTSATLWDTITRQGRAGESIQIRSDCDRVDCTTGKAWVVQPQLDLISIIGLVIGIVDLTL